MKAPSAPTVGLQADRRPDYTADRTVPMENPNARMAQQFGGALEDTGRTVSILAHAEQLRVDRAKAKEADAKLADGFREILTSPVGYRNKLGRAALDGREEVVKALDDHRRQILGTLSPEQRELVSDSDEARYQHARSAVDGHYSQQLEAYEVAETEARANALMHDSFEGFFLPASPEGAAQDPQKPVGEATQKAGNAFEDNRKAMRTELVELAARKGMGPDATKQLLQKADDNLYSGIVGTLIDGGRTSDAAALLKEAPISTEKKVSLQRSLSHASIAEEAEAASVSAQQQAAKEFQSGRTADSPPMTLLDIESGWERASDLVHGNSKLSVEARDKALDRLEADRKRVMTGYARKGAATLQQATQILSEPQNLLRGAEALPTSTAMLVDAFGVRDDLNAWLNSGRRYVSDPMVESHVGALGDDELRNTSVEVLTYKYRGKLDDRAYNLLLSRKRQAHGTSNKNDDLAISRDTKINQAFRTLANIPFTEKLTEPQAKLEAVYRKNLQRRIDGEPTDVPLSTARLDEILDELALEGNSVYTPGVSVVGGTSTWMGIIVPRTPLALLTDAEKENADFDTAPFLSVGNKRVRFGEVPKEEREAIARRLRGQREEDISLHRTPVTEVSEQQVLRLWVAGGETGKKKLKNTPAKAK